MNSETLPSDATLDIFTYYFSTQGCKFWVSFGATVLDEEVPLVAAAAARALLSKKLAMTFQTQDFSTIAAGSSNVSMVRGCKRHKRD